MAEELGISYGSCQAIWIKNMEWSITY